MDEGEIYVNTLSNGFTKLLLAFVSHIYDLFDGNGCSLDASLKLILIRSDQKLSLYTFFPEADQPILLQTNGTALIFI